MHIAESFALASGAKLNNQRLYERFTPIGSNQYISFHKIHYDQYQEVLNLIQPILKSYGIDVLQIGGTNYPKILSLPKIKDYGSASYVLRNSLLHFGEYSILFDLCSSVNTKSLILNSIGYEKIICPFFSNKDDQTVINNYSKNNSLPLFDSKSSKNLLNEIKPEDIAAKILNLLGLDFNKPYDTLYRGEYYKENFFEINIYPIKDYVYDLSQIPEPILRLDYHFDLVFLEKHLQNKKCRIRTNKEIPISIIEKYADKISGIDLEIKNRENFAQFIKAVKKLKVELLLFSFLDENICNDLKMQYLDVEPINFQKSKIPIVDFNLNHDNLYFKCDEVILYKDKFYICKEDIINNNFYDPIKFNKLSSFNLSDNFSNILIVRNLTNRN
jgi:hypothetical protein